MRQVGARTSVMAGGRQGPSLGSGGLGQPTTGRYFDQIASSWVDRYADHPSFQERLRVVAHVVESLLAGVDCPWVFDFGGGPGIFSLLCSDRASFVLDLDPSLEMLRAGVSGHAAMEAVLGRATLTPPRVVRRAAGTLDAVSVNADGRFDLVLAIAVLEYLEDPGGAVARLARLLRPGGALLLTVPRARSIARRTERLMGHIMVGTERDSDLHPRPPRSYTRLRPYGDRVPWDTAVASVGLRIELRRPLALASAGPMSYMRPNDIVVLRRGQFP
ncbi:class I SAM-dependent methyltransferase [Parafrankia sp. BMG5.11]|uniref:class I SAM-dependent methyltransferase n=1 Tax=Parafrankia sp. BMG5.11 TaxID=222540 RepID=UPI0014042F78|nr:class I SAM-dependent methyltransferase [Parafrankia sp. BMG5.11]